MSKLSLSEILSRFILNKRYIRSNNTVRWNVFIPDKNGETLVFRTSGISNKEIWDIGEREVAESRKKTMLGRANIFVDDVFKNGLEVVPHEPPEKHANIIGWPNIKSEQRLIALELASEAHFYKKGSAVSQLLRDFKKDKKCNDTVISLQKILRTRINRGAKKITVETF